MIESFGSEDTENIFRSNWSNLLRGNDLGNLERCFFGLLLLDAAYNMHDLRKVFGERLVQVEGGSIGDRFVIEPKSPFDYGISFVWVGRSAIDVCATLAEENEEGENFGNDEAEEGDGSV